MKTFPPYSAALEVILYPGRIRPLRVTRLQVEGVDRPVPVAEVVDAVVDDRRGLDRRADRVPLQDRAVVAVQDENMSRAHRVRDDRVAQDCGRRGHAVARIAPPGDLSRLHRDGPDDAVRVADEGHAVGDDGRKLDEAPHPARPGDPEGRPELDPLLHLGSRRDDAVHRPLQRGLVEVQRPPHALVEAEPDGPRRVSRRPGRHRQRTRALYVELADRAGADPVLPSCDRDGRRPDLLVRVAVDHRDIDGAADRLRLRRRRLGLRFRGRRRRWRRGRLRVVRAAAGAACGEAGYGHEHERGADHASPGSLAIGSGTSSENGSRVPSSAVVKVRCERKRVIITPSRKSPRRGSGRSPSASAIASSG